MSDAAHVITKCMAATDASTPEEARRARVEVAPAFMKCRVASGEELPEVEVRSGEGDEELVAAVLGFVVRDMKGELMVELMHALSQRRR